MLLTLVTYYPPQRAHNRQRAISGRSVCYATECTMSASDPDIHQPIIARDSLEGDNCALISTIKC